jgi:pyruvate kinase
MRKTKIVCTIGPASHSPETLREMVLAGMDVARLNFSHGTLADHEKRFNTLRKIADELDPNVGVMFDLQGPKIRSGKLKGGKPITLKEGQKLVITTENVEGGSKRITTTYDALPKDVEPGEQILLADGAIELRVVSVTGKEVTCDVINGGPLGEHKGINLPGTKISAPHITGKDRKDLEFALGLGGNYIAMSFVRSEDGVKELKDLLEKQGSSLPVVAKIEKPEALSRIDAIYDAADAIMVARGDLGVEIPAERVPAIQKRLILKANERGLPVVTATQMLESMISSPRPTRAEASDVANAIYDGTDAVMLSAETAMGKYPVESVRMMARIAEEADRAVALHRRSPRRQPQDEVGFHDAIGSAVWQAVDDLGAEHIVCFTMSGFTAKLISSYRPNANIIAVTQSDEVMRQLALYWGVEPIKIGPVCHTDEMVGVVEKKLLELSLAKKGETLVITAGTPLMVAGTTNMIRLHRVGDPTH